MIDYEILASGSSGNATVINGNVLIDCGVPYKTLAPHVHDLSLVLLTHEHGDHFNASTVSRLAKERPTLRWGCGSWMIGPLMAAGVEPKMIDLMNADNDVWWCYKGLSVSPFRLTHNVPNCGWRVKVAARDTVFYATDTGTLDGVNAKNYDLYLIEANHKRDEIEARIKEKHDAGEFAYEAAAARNHLSEEQAIDWLAENAGPKSKYVFMHRHKEKQKEEDTE